MKTPPLLLGAALLFWGWHTGFLVGAAIIALALEGSRLVAWRYELSRDDLARIRKLCALVLVATVAYIAATVEPMRAVLVVFSLYPLTVLPFVVAHAYSPAGTVDANTLFFGSWRGVALATGRPRAPLDPSYPYLAILILAAAAANVRAPWFYAGLCLLSAWALMAARPKRSSSLLWMALLVAACTLGYVGHVGLHGLHEALVGGLSKWLVSGGEVDPSQSYTAIGQIGSLKLSNEIVLRVEPVAGGRPPALLHEASYTRYASSIWSAGDSDFDAVQPAPDGTTWRLRQGTGPSQLLTIFAPLRGGRGILPLPYGASRIEQLPVGAMQKNRLGAVKVSGGPGLAAYQARFAPGASEGGPPDDTDLSVPRRDLPVLSRIVGELGLASQSPRRALLTVADYFQRGFRYSTFQGDRPLAASPLEEFLLRSRSGHCEYFATATVLLLRQAGIPARYATGYSVQEFSRLENRYVVRARHAHAWTLVYVDGAWQALDTTPASWFAGEQQTAPWWGPLLDLWSWAAFQVSHWRWSLRGAGFLGYIGWLLIPLAVLLVWRFSSARRVTRPGKGRQQTSSFRSWPGEDSEFYLLEKRLSELGLGRHPWEPPGRWLRRLDAARLLPLAAEPLSAIVSLHYRYRFDPDGISPTEREALKSGVRSWLEQDAARESRP